MSSLVVFAVLALDGTAARAQVNAAVESGKLEGITDQGVDEFLGIPYAQPPVGRLRWHAPQTQHPWEGMREAKAFGSPCPQKIAFPGPSDRSTNEDCLYLNVYRPSVSLGQGPYPVMVWIHGGSNTNGSGQDYDPSQMVSQNGIVVVTVNYRLGVFGWLPIPTAESPEGRASGNFGLMDQQAALAWVQRNIGFFGGDPLKVTVAGESSGAFGICANLASPKAKGLFHQAIMQSFDCHQATRAYTEQLTRDVVKKMMCDGEKPEQVASCMNALPVSTLLNAADDLQSVDFTLKSVSFGGYIDGDLIPIQPEQAVASGDWNKVPVLLGSDRDEAGEATFGALKLLQRNVTSSQEDNEPQYWPLSERTYRHIMRSKYGGEAQTVESEYTGAAYPTPFDAFSAVNTDSYVLGCGISPQADIFALQTLTYRYEFSDPHTPLPKLVALSAGAISLGAYHSGELQYLFSEKGYPGPRSPAEQALSARMIRYWGNFVKNGDPTDGVSLQWPRYEIGKSDLLTLSPSGDSVANNFETEHHCQLWKSLALVNSSVEEADRPR